MVTLLQMYFGALILSFLIFLIVYILQKRFKDTITLCWNSINDAITLNSGLIIIIHLVGKIFKIEWLVLNDDYALYVALLIASLLILGHSIDKLKKQNHEDKNEKKSD